MAPESPAAPKRPPPTVRYGSPPPVPPAASPASQQVRPPVRPPVRRRVSSRRPLPPLIFLVILAVIALGVWFKVLQSDEARPSTDADACPAPPTVTALDPATIRLRVYNASEIPGLAAQASAEFLARGFAVTETDNDRSGREVLAIGELRYGARGAEKAAFVALFVPGIALVRDSRADDLIDIALGPDYAGLAAPEAVAIAIATPVAPTNLACATGDPSATVGSDPAATT